MANQKGKILFAHNTNKNLIPASIWKIAVSLAAIKKLGLKHSFKTEFYLDKQFNLLIKGYGDPRLISEELAIIATELKKRWDSNKSAQKNRGFRCHNIILDTSLFSTQLEIPGVSKTDNPYDALNGALVTNFNTVYLKRSKGREIISAEEQTPITPLAIKLGRANSKFGKFRINLSDSREKGLQYAGQLFRAFLEQKGIICKGKIKEGLKEKNFRLIYAHKSSYNLADNISALMEFSNNYIANQLLLSLTTKTPAHLTTAVKELKSILEQEVGVSRFKAVEGSGISRHNRISAREMLKLVQSFRPYRHLLKNCPGKNSLLKRCNYKNSLYKTGTLSNVRSIAGFLWPKKSDIAFVIIMNRHRGNGREKIYGLLKKAFRPNTDKIVPVRKPPSATK